MPKKFILEYPEPYFVWYKKFTTEVENDKSEGAPGSTTSYQKFVYFLTILKCDG